MAITGNPGDLATGGYGTGNTGLSNRSGGSLANSTRDGGFASAGGFGGGGGGGGGAIGTGFRGPATTWGSGRSVVPGSILGRQLSSPLSPYGGAFNVTQDQLVDAALSNARLLGGTIQNPSLGMLQKMGAQIQASPELQGVLGSVYGPFMAGGTPTAVPSGVLGSALDASLPAATAPAPQINEAVNEGQFLDSLLGSQLASIKAGENIDAPVSPAMTGKGWVDIAPGVNVDSPQVQDLIKMAEAASAKTGQRLTITSGVAGRTAGSLQHPAGVAIDLRAYSPVTGEALGNYQSPENFSAYEGIANAMRAAQQSNFPQYNDTLRWGGYFSGGPETYGALDLMHFDVNNPKGLGMAGGSWESGLTPQMRQTWGIDAPTAPGVLGPITVASNTPSPSPAPTVTPASTVAAFQQPMPPRTPTPGILDRVASNVFGTSLYDTGPGFVGGATKSTDLASQMLAGAQPQAPEAGLAAPPAYRPTSSGTSLASLLFDAARDRSTDRERKKKRKTSVDETMNDTIGGLLA